MSFLNIFQIIVCILIIVLVTMQVSKSSNGISGLMGASFSKNKTNMPIEKSQKIVFILVLIFMGFSFFYSFNKSQEYKSVINENSIEEIKDSGEE